jgi:hypothetical protein
MSEELLREQVLDAHRTLMSLNKQNEESFCDLVDALESEKQPVSSPARATAQA